MGSTEIPREICEKFVENLQKFRKLHKRRTRVQNRFWKNPKLKYSGAIIMLLLCHVHARKKLWKAVLAAVI